MGVMVATEHILDNVLKQVTCLDATQQFGFFNMMRGDPGLESSFRNFHEKLLYLRSTGDPTATTFMCHPSTTRFWNERQCCLVLINPDQGRATGLTLKVLEDYPELEVRYSVLPSGTSTLTSLQLEKLLHL